MAKAHPKNERAKRRYFQWLETAKGASEATIDQAAAAIAAFERSTGGKDFAAFHIEQAMKFKRDLEKPGPEKSDRLAKATIRSRLMAVKGFCKWLADQPGYKRRISHADCEYFNPTANDTRIATARRERPVPTIEQVHRVLACALHETDVEKRDRALIAFTLLTGMRDAAIASLPLGKVDLGARLVDQDARVVATKNAKTMRTYFFPVGGEAEAIVAEWIDHLRRVLLFSHSDPLFPSTKVSLGGDGAFAAAGLARAYWTSASPIRRIFRERFEAAGLPYFHPHSFRKTLMQLAFKRKLDPEALKVWSQNLGHDNLATSLNSYGHVNDWRAGEVMAALANGEINPDVDVPAEVVAWFARQTRRK